MLSSIMWKWLIFCPQQSEIHQNMWSEVGSQFEKWKISWSTFRRSNECVWLTKRELFKIRQVCGYLDTKCVHIWVIIWGISHPRIQQKSTCWQTQQEGGLYFHLRLLSDKLSAASRAHHCVNRTWAVCQMVTLVHCTQTEGFHLSRGLQLHTYCHRHGL